MISIFRTLLLSSVLTVLCMPAVTAQEQSESVKVKEHASGTEVKHTTNQE